MWHGMIFAPCQPGPSHARPHAGQKRSQKKPCHAMPGQMIFIWKTNTRNDERRYKNEGRTKDTFLAFCSAR